MTKLAAAAPICGMKMNPTGGTSDEKPDMAKVCTPECKQTCLYEMMAKHGDPCGQMPCGGKAEDLAKFGPVCGLPMKNGMPDWEAMDDGKDDKKDGEEFTGKGCPLWLAWVQACSKDTTLDCKSPPADTLQSICNEWLTVDTCEKEVGQNPDTLAEYRVYCNRPAGGHRSISTQVRRIRALQTDKSSSDGKPKSKSVDPAKLCSQPCKDSCMYGAFAKKGDPCAKMPCGGDAREMAQDAPKCGLPMKNGQPDWEKMDDGDDDDDGDDSKDNEGGHRRFRILQMADGKTAAGKTAGLLRSANGFSFLQVHDAGHMVPRDQPAVALAMLNAFTKGDF
jgi:hypothetical protein